MFELNYSYRVMLMPFLMRYVAALHVVAQCVSTLTGFLLNLNWCLSDCRGPGTTRLKSVSYRACPLARPSLSISPSVHPPQMYSLLSL